MDSFPVEGFPVEGFPVQGARARQGFAFGRV